MIARKNPQMGQRNPNHQLIDGLPHGGAGFRWPIHSIFPNASIWGCNGYTHHTSAMIGIRTVKPGRKKEPGEPLYVLF